MTTTPSPSAPFPVTPVAQALVTNLLMLGFVLSGELDLTGYTVALALEAALFGVFTARFRTEKDPSGLWGKLGIGIGVPLGIAGFAGAYADWNQATLLTLVAIVATSAVGLALRVRQAGTVFSAVPWWLGFGKVGTAVLAAVLAWQAHGLVALYDAGWRPEDSDATSGMWLVRLGEHFELTPSTTLAAAMVVLYGFHEVLYTAYIGLGARRFSEHMDEDGGRHALRR